MEACIDWTSNKTKEQTRAHSKQREGGTATPNMEQPTPESTDQQVKPELNTQATSNFLDQPPSAPIFIQPATTTQEATQSKTAWDKYINNLSQSGTIL